MIRERILLWVMCAGILLFLLWSIFFKIDVAAMMMGEVIPSGQIKRVQHLEGGIVANILVKEGQKVAAGEALIELASARPDADVQELRLKLRSLQVDVLRLQSLLAGSGNMTVATDADQGSELEAGIELFNRQWQHYQARLQEQTQQLALRKVEKDAEQAKVRHLLPRLGFIREQIAISDQLMKDGLSNRFEHLDLLKEANSIEADIDHAKINLARIDVVLKKEQAALDGVMNDQQETWNKELVYARKMLAELGERLNKFVDSQLRTVVRAPVAGTVFNLFVHNAGAVIPPGGQVLTIVPEDGSLLIEAKMMVADVGYVKEGQPVKLQLASDSSAGFQPLSGYVDYISADAVSEPKQMPYFLVRIRPEEYVFTNGHQSYPLLPGVSVQANVLTGQRSLFNYLINPIFQNLSTALTER